MRRALHPVGVGLALALLAPGGAWAAGDAGGGDLAWRVANTLVLLAVLYAVARKPVRSFFHDRRDRIRGEVEQAARMRSEAEERYARLERQLAELDTELERIRSTSKERAESERERIVASAQATAQRIREDAQLAIDQELRRARDELRREASELAVELAAELLRGEVTSEDRERLVDEFIERVEHPPSQGAS